VLLNFRIKLQDFIKRNKSKIFIGFIVIAVIIGVNIFLGKRRESAPPSISYEPHAPIISGSEVKSKSVKENIETKINEYMKFCNEKNYEAAYAYLADDCKECRFENDIENFKKYVDYIFDENKIYSIQDYSNKNNIYVYQVIISEDIMATGMNTETSDQYYDEKVVITKNGDEYKLAVAGFIQQKLMEKISEDQYMKLTVEKKVTYYDKIIYIIKIKNKTNYDIVLERDKEENCIGVYLGSETREQEKELYSNTEKAIGAGKTKTIELTFSKYFDESLEPKSIIFNKVRVLEKYTGVDELWEQELEKAIDKYSMTISV